MKLVKYVLSVSKNKFSLFFEGKRAESWIKERIF